MSTRTIILLWGAIIVFHILIAFGAQMFIPYHGGFPYKEILQCSQQTHSCTEPYLPQWITGWASFDGANYIIIAKEGYKQYLQAFFPLYPISIALLAHLMGKEYLIAGLCISSFFLLGSLILMHRYLKTLGTSIEGSWDKNNAWYITLFLVLFPTAYYFNAVYTESMFLFFILGYFYFFERKNNIGLIIMGYLVALVRINGLFVILLPLAHIMIHGGYTWYTNKKERLSALYKTIFQQLRNNLASILSPILGFVTYAIYLWQTTGDPLFFLTSQPYFGAQRSSSLILLPQVQWRYMNIFATFKFDLSYWVAILEFMMFHAVLGLLLYDLYRVIVALSRKYTSPKDGAKNTNTLYSRLGISLFSIATLLLGPLTGTFSSVPRYALMCISMYFVLASISYTWVKNTILWVFIIVHIMLTGLFVQGYFVS